MVQRNPPRYTPEIFPVAPVVARPVEVSWGSCFFGKDRRCLTFVAIILRIEDSKTNLKESYVFPLLHSVRMRGDTLI